MHQNPGLIFRPAYLVHNHRLRIAPERWKEGTDNVEKHHEGCPDGMQGPQRRQQIRETRLSDCEGKLDVCLIDGTLCAGHEICAPTTWQDARR
jgi:hypothetical protein